MLERERKSWETEEFQGKLKNLTLAILASLYDLRKTKWMFAH